MKRLFTSLAAIVIAAVLSGLIPAPPAAAGDVTYSFNLIGPQLTKAPSGPLAGDTLRTTGSGSFDSTAQTVVASGSFKQFDASGSVLARGTWVATAFVSFEAFGGPNPGIQGGALKITVTLFPDGGTPMPGIPMSVTCLVHAPPGFTEGVTVGDFTQKIIGRTLFHLNN